MISIAVVCILIFCLLLLTEFLRSKKHIPAELSRKLVHMGSGVLVAFLPYFTSYDYIQGLSIAFLVVVLISSKLSLFKSIHSVKRATKGEILYAVGIGVSAFLEPAPWIFAVAILHLAIADAVAAVVGTKWGKRTRYKILSHGKSFLGSMSFFYVSMGIFACLYLFSSQTFTDVFILLVVLPTILTLIENVSWYGLDNLTIPLMCIVLLNGLA